MSEEENDFAPPSVDCEIELTISNQTEEATFNIDGFGDEELSPFNALPPAQFISILSYLTIPELLTVQLVSKEWLVYGRCTDLWRGLYEHTNWTVDIPSHFATESSPYELYRIHYQREIEQNADACTFEEEEEPIELIDLLKDSTISTEKLITLLKMDEFMLALQGGEEEVLTFLECPETITEMMKLLFLQPFDLDDAQYQRVIHITVQTLVSGIIIDVFIMNVDLIHILLDHLEMLDIESPGATVRSGCIAKIIIILFEKFPSQMISYFQSRENFIPSLLLNVHDQNLMEILNKIVATPVTHEWLFEVQLVTLLVGLLHKDETEEMQENAANVLFSILSLCQPCSDPQRHGKSVLVNDMLENELITGSIIAYMEGEPHSGIAIKQGLCVLIAILSLIGDELEDPPTVVYLLAGSTKFFAKLLMTPGDIDNTEPFRTTTGLIQRGFGIVRLSVLEFLVSLLYTGFPNVVEFMLEEGIFSIVLDLMFTYSWNNIIHHQISQLFSGLFCCNNPEIIINVLLGCRLPERIADAHATAEENPVGFLGHLRELANELVKLGKMSPPILEYLETKAVWSDFVNGTLKDLNHVECVVQDYFDMDKDMDADYGDLDGDVFGAYEEYNQTTEEDYEDVAEEEQEEEKVIPVTQREY